MPKRSRRGLLVQLAVETKLGPGLHGAEIVRRLREMLVALTLDKVELSVVLTGDDQIKELNRVYRHKPKPTDVLAFPMHEMPVGEQRGRLLGDIVVSIPTSRAQAARAGHPVLDEVTMLLAHGLLHLLGWDHDTPRKDVAMRRETERLCEAAAVVSKRRAGVRRVGPQRREPSHRKLS